MKRFITGLAALAVVACSLIPTQAQAIRLVSENLRWRNENASNVGGIRDTLYQSLAVGVNDTLVAFTTQNWAIPAFSPSASPTVTDSLLVGWIVLSTDSSVATTPSATSATIIIEGSGVGNDLNFSPMATTTFTDPTTTDKAWKIPIYLNPWLARGASAASPGLGNLWPVMRMRIVTIGGVFTACRASVVHFVEN